MTQEVIEKPRGIAGKPATGGAESPLHEGPVSKRDLLLKSISELCTARFKSRLLQADSAGIRCSPEAAQAHSLDRTRDAEADVKAASLELLPLKFDISREAYGTEDTYVVIKSGEQSSLFALHGIILNDGGHAGISTLALKVPPELVPEIVAELKSDPTLINSILHSVFPSASGLSFSIKTRIDVIFDRSYFVCSIGEPNQ